MTRHRPAAGAMGRRSLPLAGALLTTALLLASVGADAQNTLRIANSGEPKSLDPHQLSGTWENRIAGDMFLGLTTEAPDGSTVPGAAESWEVSEDGLVYTFELRPHDWSDGEPVTAQDFVYGMRRLLDPATAAEYASLLYTVKNAQAINSGEIKDTAQLAVRAIDDATLEITLEYPAPYFIDQLTHYTAFPVPQHLIEAKGPDWVKPGTIVGNGAYTVTEWVPNSQVVATKNPNFYDAANVAIDEVIFYPAEERNAATRRFRAGEIDVQYDFASEQIEWLRENLPDETRVAPWLGIYYYAINTSRAPFTDPRVRHALSMTIDREALTDKVLKSGERPAYSFVPPNTGTYGEPSTVPWNEVPYPERLAEAKELMAAAGHGPGNPLKLQLRYNTSETHKKAAVAVAAMWKQLGVEVELLNSEVKVHYDVLKQADFDVARAGWIADYNDPQNFLYLLETRTGPNNYGRYSNPDYDRLMAQSNTTLAVDERMRLLHEAEKIALADSATIPLWYYVSKNLVASRVKGWVDNTKDIHRTRYLTLE